MLLLILVNVFTAWMNESKTKCLITEVAMETRDYICDVFGGRLPARRTDGPSLVCAWGGSLKSSAKNPKKIITL